jgi:hypothetical protein
MALTLAQASVLGQNQLKDGVIEMFPEYSIIIGELPFIPVTGNAYEWRRELTLPGAATRAVNGSWTESTGTFETKSVGLKIYGGEAHVDRFIQQTMGGTNDHIATQTELKVKAVTAKIHGDLINGDSAANPDAFDGIKKRMPAGQIVNAAADKLDVNLDDASRNAYLDKLDELVSLVAGGANALYMNATMLRKTRSVARRMGFHDSDRDEFGRVVDFYNGIPLRDIGKNPDGTEIITNTEPSGAATPTNDTTSIYAAGYGEDRLAGITNGGIDAYRIGGAEGEMESKPAVGVRIEAYINLADHTDKATARLRYLK